MISKFARFTLVLGVGVLAVAALATAQAKDPFVGTWNMNLAKSKYSPGPAPKSSTSTYEAAGKGYKVSVKSEPASGPVQQWSYTSDLDGKDVPINGNTLEIVNKKNGKVTTTQKNVVAADGKTRTVTTTGTDGQGQKLSNVAV